MDNPRSRKKELSLFVALCFFSAGCATTQVPNAGQAGYKVEADEARMFKRADEINGMGPLTYSPVGAQQAFDYIVQLQAKS